MRIPFFFRRLIRKVHLKFDGWVGRFVWREPSLGQIAASPHTPITADIFSNFTYSRRSHYERFRVMPVHRGQSPATCDLKVYQDIFTYTFILDNIPQGARLLEIGGGESRIIAALKERYEIWNLDKLEGAGYGPIDIRDESGFHLVKDYIGTFSPELPDAYFDLVFSISTLEHLSDDEYSIEAVIDDIQRLLKPGGYSLHCVDGLLFLDRFFVHRIVATFHQCGLVTFPIVTFQNLIIDRDLWVLPKFAFYTRWYHIVRKSMRSFGYPFSINILWQK